MNNEYRYLVTIAFWIVLWMFVPWVALPLFIIVTVRHFIAVRKQRKLQAISLLIDRDRWSRMEGLSESEKQDPADWWKL